MLHGLLHQYGAVLLEELNGQQLRLLINLSTELRRDRRVIDVEERPNAWLTHPLGNVLASRSSINKLEAA